MKIPPKKLLICTPASGGLITTQYFQSFCEMIFRFYADENRPNISLVPYTLSKESLIPRGRNRCAMKAVLEGYDKLLFIDADMGWTYEDFCRLMRSDKEIVGGTYPGRHFPIGLMFNPLEEHSLDIGNDRIRKVEGFAEYARKYASPEGEVEVTHIPTGFMLIDRTALAKLSHVRPQYAEWDSITGKSEVFIDYFPSGVVPGTTDYESEDWGFCRIAREAGIKVYLNVHCVNTHTGSHEYAFGQHVAHGQRPLIVMGKN